MVKNYIPDSGDIIYLNFDPQSGHEQKGFRPALVISPKLYNQKTGLGLFCPITNQEKNYIFEVKLPHELKTKGVILADHLKNHDWVSRKAKFIEKAPAQTLEEVIEKIKVLFP